MIKTTKKGIEISGTPAEIMTEMQMITFRLAKDVGRTDFMSTFLSSLYLVMASTRDATNPNSIGKPNILGALKMLKEDMQATLKNFDTINADRDNFIKGWRDITND